MANEVTVSERSKVFLSDRMEQLIHNVYVTTPRLTGWLEKRSTRENWIAQAVFKNINSNIWKKKWIAIEQFDVIIRLVFDNRFTF